MQSLSRALVVILSLALAFPASAIQPWRIRDQNATANRTARVEPKTRRLPSRTRSQDFPIRSSSSSSSCYQNASSNHQAAGAVFNPQTPFSAEPSRRLSKEEDDNDDDDGSRRQPEAASSSTVTSTSAAPTASLPPSVHWTVDTGPVGNVVPVRPESGSELYYGVSEPSESGHFAFVKYYFAFPSVNIDHTKHIEITHEPGGGLAASFHSEDAFRRALETWSTKEGLVLVVASAAGCEGVVEGDRCYFNVTHLDFRHQELRIDLRGAPVHPDRITSLAETEWGWWDAAESESDDGHAVKAFKRPEMQLECEAPVDRVHGLPTACLGSNFDQILDSRLGLSQLGHDTDNFLLKGNLSHVDAALGIHTNSTPWPGPGPGPDSRSRSGRGRSRLRWSSLGRRGFWSDAESFAGKALEASYNAVLSAMSIGGSTAGDLPFNLPDSASLQVTAKVPEDAEARRTASPWGDAILIHEFGPSATKTWTSSSSSEGGEDGEEEEKHMSVYCVGCSVSGHARVAGKARWSPLTGLQQGRVEVRADMHMKLKLGVDARMRLSYSVHTELFSYGLPGLSFGIVTIGPYVTLGARMKLQGSAHGKLLVGAEMGMQDSVAVLDVVGPGNNQKSGWEPYFRPAIEAEGDVAISAELGLPVSLSCGVKISRWGKAVGITAEPSIKGTASVAGSIGLQDSGELAASLNGDDGCSGIEAQLSWRSQLTAGTTDEGDPIRFALFDTGDRSLARACIGDPTSRSHRRAIHASASASSSSSSSRPTLTWSTTNDNDNDNSNQHEHQQLRLSRLLNHGASTRVVSCTNGNVYAVRNDGADNKHCSELWTLTAQSEVVYDGSRRSMHYYRDTMSKLGVSRLRVGSSDRAPHASVPVALVPLRSSGSGPSLYVAVDEQRVVFYPVVCDYADSRRQSRLFLVRDADDGVNVLSREDVVPSVTGGLVAQCQLLALTP